MSVRTKLVGAIAAGAAVAALVGPVHAAALRPSVKVGRGCYHVGQVVQLKGTGFAESRTYIVSIDGVYFGRKVTTAAGSFTASLRPGGLGAGVAQSVDHLEADDGTSTATATFTITRTAGAEVLVTGGTSTALRGEIQLWGFATDGSRRAAYVHYVAPSGRSRTTVALGRTGGQCGFLRTTPRRVFPFAPSLGTWTLQLDTRKSYSARPKGPVARIRVRLG